MMKHWVLELHRKTDNLGRNRSKISECLEIEKNLNISEKYANLREILIRTNGKIDTLKKSSEDMFITC